MKTGERVKKARALLKMTQEQFGKAAGVSKAAVSQWENGVTTPQRDALLSLSRKHHLSPEWITSGRGEMVELVIDSEPMSAEDAEMLALWAMLTLPQKNETLRTIKQHIDHNQEVLRAFGGKNHKPTPKRDPQIIDTTLPDFNEFTNYADQRAQERRREQTKIEGDRRSTERRKKHETKT